MFAWKKSTSTLWILATAFTSSIACDFLDPSDPSSNSDQLEDRTFYSQRLTENGSDKAIVPGTRLSISFGENDDLGASAGCNSFSAIYTIVNDKLELTPQGTTEIGCESKLHSQDEWYFNFLLSTPAIEVKGDALTLRTGVTTIEYLDKEIVTPDLDLVGHHWVVDTIVEGDAAMAAEWDPPAWMEWTEDNRIVLFTGCNDGEGQYSIQDDNLHFSMVRHTEKACTDMISTKLESAVQKILFHPGAVAFEIDANRLRLSIDGYGLYLRAQTHDD